jgi:hypothetical protein
MGRAVYHGGVIYWVLQLSTVAILALAANTAYADFPRLSSIIAADGFLPKQFANRGDRLVFSNGVIFLAVAAGTLIVIFGGITNALIPLYAIGVFTSFTLSQTGMVRRHMRLRQPGWRWRVAISGTGAVATCIVMIIVATTKFAKGAWVPIVVVPCIIILFKTIRRHYATVSNAMAVRKGQLPETPARHAFVILVGNIHRGVLEAIGYAISLRPDHIVGLHVSDDRGEHERVQAAWEDIGFEIPLDIVDSPYRELVEPVERYLDRLEERWRPDRTTVLIPEFVVGVKRLSNVLHGQSGLALKLALLERPNTIVTSIPFHMDMALDGTPAAIPGGADRAGTIALTELEQLDRQRLSARFVDFDRDAYRLESIPLRTPVLLAGEVTAVRVVPRAGSPSLEVALNDGSGAVTLVFTGRRRIPGIEPGRILKVEGVARDERGVVIVMNPRYTLMSLVG